MGSFWDSKTEEKGKGFSEATAKPVSIIAESPTNPHLCKLRKCHKGWSNSLHAAFHKLRLREAVGANSSHSKPQEHDHCSSLSALDRWQFYSCAPHTQYTNTSEINVCFHRIAALSWYLFQRRQSPTLSNSTVREQLYNSPSSPQGDPQIHYQKRDQTTFSDVAEVKFPSKAGGHALHRGSVSHTLFLCADLQIARMRRFSSPFI